MEWEGERCCARLSLMPAHVIQEVELWFSLDVPGREPAGRLALFRPVDGTRILTDLTVIVEELQPALLRALEGLAADRATERPPAEAAVVASRRVPQSEVQGETAEALPRAASL